MRSRAQRLRLSWTRVALGFWCALILAFLIVPLLAIVPMSFSSSDFLIFPPPGWSLRWYDSFFNTEVWTDATVTSVQIALACTAISTTIGTAAAFPIVRQRFPGKRVLLIFIVSPLIVPEIVIAIGLYFITLPAGFTDSVWTVAFGQSVLTVPFSTLIVAASLRGMDRSLEDAAMSLGATRIEVLRRVTLPLIAPAIVTASLFTFIFSLNDLLIPLFVAAVEVVPLPVLIWTSIRSSLDLTTLSVSVLWIALAFCVLAAMEIARHSRRAVVPGAAKDLQAKADEA